MSPPTALRSLVCCARIRSSRAIVFGIQRELPGQIVVEANFIRATGYDLPVSRNLNFVPRAVPRRQSDDRRSGEHFPDRRRFQTRSGISFPAAVLSIPRPRSLVRSRCFSSRSSTISGFRNTTARIVTRRCSCRSTNASRPT